MVMESVKLKKSPSLVASRPVGRSALSMAVEGLEERRLMAAWSYWENYLGFDKIAQYYPWLDGGGNSIAVIDKGIDYYHPLLAGKESTARVSPRVVNVYDYKD